MDILTEVVDVLQLRATTVQRSSMLSELREDLRNGAGLSRGVFADRFHKRVGEPPLRYLRAWRMLNARRELARGGVAVREVAARAGYCSANGFSRAFRRFFGHAPSVLRRVS